MMIQDSLFQVELAELNVALRCEAPHSEAMVLLVEYCGHKMQHELCDVSDKMQT
jgi:hypothetical protein